MTFRKKNLSIVGITIVLYLANQVVKKRILVEPVRWFLSCYFNDTIGGITFVAYCNVVFSFYNKRMTRLWHIELLLLFSGIFWEYITPLFRENTVSDIWDIAAYMMGGLLYWLAIRKEQHEN